MSGLLDTLTPLPKKKQNKDVQGRYLTSVDKPQILSPWLFKLHIKKPIRLMTKYDLLHLRFPQAYKINESLHMC